MGKISTRGTVLNRGYVAKCRSGYVFNTPLSIVVRSLKGADAGASGEYFKINDLH